MRSYSDLLIYIDIGKAMKDGIEFLLSENGVILTTGVEGILHPKYFSHVLQAPQLIPFDKDFPQQREKTGSQTIIGDVTKDEIKDSSQTKNGDNPPNLSRSQQRNKRRKKKEQSSKEDTTDDNTMTSTSDQL